MPPAVQPFREAAFVLEGMRLRFHLAPPLFAQRDPDTGHLYVEDVFDIDLVEQALEIEEDFHLARFAENREKSLKKSSALSHDEVWS